MNFREAAVRVLLDEDKPLHYEDITRLALERGYLVPKGKTPQDSISTELSRDMRLRGDISVFEKCGKGTYGIKQSARAELLDLDPGGESSSPSVHGVL